MMSLSRGSTFFVLSWLTLSSIIQSAACWGTLGHRTIAYLAQRYFSSETEHYVNVLLEYQDISDAAIWADIIRKTPLGASTAAWHFIDAEDDPPRNCTVNYSRDCHANEGCAVSAITNMTERINDPDLPTTQRSEALRFLIHLIGDIHQPLHTEAELRGGNGIPVFFGKKNTTLHGIWDNDIPNQIRGGAVDNNRFQASDWAYDLFVKGIEGSCTDISTPEDCALVWAGEANAKVCTYVLKDDLEGVEGQDLSGDYYEGAVPIVEELIAKAGYRLGAWLNALAKASEEREGELKHRGEEL